MADTHDTIADIIAEKRRRADELEASSYRPHQFLRERIAELRQEANRLEAAHKREAGDAAKLREALETLRELLGDLLRLGDAEYHNDFSNFCDIIDAALAAPPRNCDKYATADEALKAQEQMFNDSNFANGECKLGCPECDNPRVGCKIAWLLAPATEKEGGAE